MNEQLNTIGQIFVAISFIGIAIYGWYQSYKFEKAGGWSGKPKADKAK